MLTRSTSWTATSSFAVLPQQSDAATTAGYYETLSRGQIVSTIAEVVRVQGARSPARVQVAVEVVPETTLVQLTTVAPDADTAVSVADARLAAGIAAVRALGIPYQAQVVEKASDTVVRTTASRVKDVAVVALAALGAALLVHQALAQMRGRRRRRRGTAGEGRV